MIFLFIAVTLSIAALPTSCSDTDEYNDFCQLAAENPDIFAQFKNAPIYNNILEHVSFEQGKAYLEMIKEQTPELLEHINDFRKNDSIGNPKTYFYEGIGEISPTTLRYIKVASDLKRFYGSDFDQYSIIEIGGGYGGQAKIFADLFSFKSYTIIDLPGAIALTKKFLENQGIHSIDFKTNKEHILDQTFDLVIANYSFCECTEEMQEQYIKEILSHSKRGYLLCNLANSNLTPTTEEMLKKLSDHGIPWEKYPDHPLFNPSNFILIWKDPQDF